jgi:cobalamin biosynthesis protein CobD/CbiB
MSRKKRDRGFTASAVIAVFMALGFDFLGEPPAAWHPVVWGSGISEKVMVD